jgi:hypothetical protein
MNRSGEGDGEEDNGEEDDDQSEVDQKARDRRAWGSEGFGIDGREEESEAAIGCNGWMAREDEASGSAKGFCRSIRSAANSISPKLNKPQNESGEGKMFDE